VSPFLFNFYIILSNEKLLKMLLFIRYPKKEKTTLIIVGYNTALKEEHLRLSQERVKKIKQLKLKLNSF